MRTRGNADSDGASDTCALDVWRAVSDDLELEWYRPFEQVVDTSRGIAWPRWWVGGQFNYVAQKAMGLPVGLPQPQIWVPGSEVQKKDDALKKANSNLDLNDYAQLLFR